MTPSASKLLTRLCIATAVLVVAPGCAWRDAPRFRLATFHADVTPPIGHPLLGGPWKPATSVRDPLRALGFVLLSDELPIVFVAVDWCEIRGESHDRWRHALAEAADTTPERVLLTSVHQHDAPLADRAAQRYLSAHGLDGALMDVKFAERTIRRVARTLEDSIEHASPIDGIDTGRGKVSDIASSRRVVGADGKVTFSRYSYTREAATRDAPIGEIDPWIRCVRFRRGEHLALVLNVYACHPMSNYGSGAISADFVGDAREEERRRQGVPCIYASGPAGDVTGGKFNDGTEATRTAFADRLLLGMTDASASVTSRPLREVKLRVARLQLPARNDDRFNRRLLEKTLADANAPRGRRIDAALGLSWLDRLDRDPAIDVSCIDLGVAALVLLPAESFVAYQVAAQTLRPDDFIVTVGYGECGPGYIPTDRARAEGYVEEHGWCGIAPGVENAMREAVRSVLTGPSSTRTEGREKLPDRGGGPSPGANALGTSG